LLEQFVDWVVYSLIGLSANSALGKAVNFFVFDSIKIIALLFVMIFAISILRTFISQRKIKELLTRRGKFSANTGASIFGALTPFCSCSSIPIFISLIEAGVPLGAAFSFLITSPIVNEYVVIVMLGFFGWEITAAYIISGIAIGVIAGIVLGKMGLEKHLETDLISKGKKSGQEEKFESFKKRILFGLTEAASIVKKLWVWIIVGVGIGAVIHNLVPEEAIHQIISQGGILTVPIATAIGVPVYGNSVAIVPIAVALFQKGVPLGTALAFMMAIAALSLPEAVILRRVMKLKLIAIFFTVVAVAIVATGYLFNILQTVLV
jgi:hypothetical protein